MKKIMTVLLLSLVSMAAMAADEAEKKAAAQDVLDASNAKAIFTEARKQIEGMTDQALTANIPADDQAMLKRYQKRVQTILEDGLNWEAMENNMLGLYQRTFTLKELEDMADFYQSESGKAIMKKMPQVMAESVQMSQRQMQQVMPMVQQMFSDLEAELAQAETQKE
ncbi:MAG: DUF2059 domain-containing protein [Pseudomonadales bacterium]|nr:DUF2059 domain-containing protein [Pseudomonadales bacterium]